MKWKLGDKVRLTSNGPVMTVIGFSRNGNVWCDWTNKNGYRDEGNFPPESLEMVQP